jgi:hypothetical protein
LNPCPPTWNGSFANDALSTPLCGHTNFVIFRFGHFLNPNIGQILS